MIDDILQADSKARRAAKADGGWLGWIPVVPLSHAGVGVGSAQFVANDQCLATGGGGRWNP